MKWVNLLNLVLNVIQVDNKDIRMTSTCFFIINFEHVIAFILARWFGLSNKGLVLLTSYVVLDCDLG